MTSHLWGATWRSSNALDGDTRHIVMSCRKPLLFITRAQARRFIAENYGYIRKRKDLRKEPHGWKMPMPVKVRVEMVNI